MSGLQDNTESELASEVDNSSVAEDQSLSGDQGARLLTNNSMWWP
jgi:hypothetical protein